MNILKSKTVIILVLMALTTMPCLARNGGPAKDSLRVEMPLDIGYENGRVTPSIVIEINHVKYRVIFDTGSHGLKILKGALTPAKPQNTGRRMQCSFGSNVKSQLFLKGDVMSGSFSAGGLSATSNIKFMSVDMAGYGSADAMQSTGDSALIQSTHFRDLPAIMGVGLRAEGKEGVGNLLAMLPGNGKYIIKFPRFGGGKGKLIINPTPEDEAGFTWYHLPADDLAPSPDYTGWADNKLKGMLIVDDQQYYQNTLLDTGNPDTQIYSEAISTNSKVGAGSRVELRILPDDNAGKTAVMSFTVSQHREAGKDAVYLRNGTKPKNIFGTMFFFNFDVEYDQKNGVIGVKAK